MPAFVVTIQVTPKVPVTTGTGERIAGAFVTRLVAADDREAAVQAALASIRADPKFALFAPGGVLPDWRVDEVRSRDQLPDPLVQPDWVFYQPEENGRAGRWILGTALAAIVLALLILLPWIRRLLAD